jgi:hypothetical protein
MLKVKRRTTPESDTAADVTARSAPKRRAQRTGIKTSVAPGKQQRKLARVAVLFGAGLMGVIGGIVLLNHSTATTPVYITTKSVPAGSRITESDIGVTYIAAPGVPGTLSLPQILSGRTTVALLPGEVLTVGLVSSSNLASTQAVVGLDLSSGHLPNSGISVGDTLEMVYTGQEPLSLTATTIDPGKVLGTGMVTSIAPGPSGSGMLVDVLVSRPLVSTVTTVAANNDIALARVSG